MLLSPPMTDPDIATLLRIGSERLASVSDTARLDTEILLAHVLAKPRAHLYTWPERIPESATRSAFIALLERRARGEPIAYLTGRRAFWSLELQVTPDTLIPRPESELLVTLALERLPEAGGPRVVDLGTGSGVLALALAVERPDCTVIAIDRSIAALSIAETNARELGLSNIEFRHGDWCSGLDPEEFDLIVANPPYVADDSPWLRHGDVRFEPRNALVAGRDGLDAIRRIVQQAPAILKSGGWLLIEHGFDQGAAVRTLLREQGFRAVECHTDPNGRDRVGGGYRP